MLRLESLGCGYGPVRAVEDVSFELAAHSSLALLGPNGAGQDRRTLLAIMGHCTITGGRIWVEGRDIHECPRRPPVDLGIAWFPRVACCFPI